MTNSPVRQTQTQEPSSPYSPGRLRKQQSAHQLSSHYPTVAKGPSLISQQRQQQQRTTNTFQNPPVPVIPSHFSPQKPARTRSNSETGALGLSKPAAPLKRPEIIHRKTTFKDEKAELEYVIRHGPQKELSLARDGLRHLVLEGGISSDQDGMSHTRIYVWLVLLNALPVPTDYYLELMRRGASPAHAKICDDTFRTFKTNPLFKRRVTDNSLIRLLNATAWKLHDAKKGKPPLQPSQHTSLDDSKLDQSNSHPTPSIYVQGMNVLCAPFLYVARSEAEAFGAFHKFITLECPGYVRGAMDGVHKGVMLVDRCLKVADPSLSAFLLSKGLEAEVYAFSSVLTLCAGTPPLPEVLNLWDFLLAYGVHLNILCICVQLCFMKDEIRSSQSPGIKFQPLKASEIIGGTVLLAKKIPNDLYQDLIDHVK